MEDSQKPVEAQDLIYSLMNAAKLFTDGRVYEDENTDFFNPVLSVQTISAAEKMIQVPNSGLYNLDAIKTILKNYESNLQQRVADDNAEAKMDLVEVFQTIAEG